MKNNRILIIGALPSSCGIGGVTIHIERLCQNLKIQGIPFTLCDYKTHNLPHIIKEIIQHSVIHIHASNPILRIIHISIAKLFTKKVVFTVHGNLGRFLWFKNWLDKLAVKLSDIPILINQNSFEKAILWNKNSKLLSAFIPPLKEDNLPDMVVTTIIKERTKGKTIIASNASIRSFTNTGEETYGIEFLIHFFKNRSNYFFCLSDPSKQYFEKYKNEKFDNILFITEPHSFYALIKLSDIILRNTATDGDSLSIKEGLYLQKKVIATNRVDRPVGVILFKYNDVASLNSALKAPPLQLSIHNKDTHTIETLVSIYNQLR